MQPVRTQTLNESTTACRVTFSHGARRAPAFRDKLAKVGWCAMTRRNSHNLRQNNCRFAVRPDAFSPEDAQFAIADSTSTGYKYNYAARMRHQNSEAI